MSDKPSTPSKPQGQSNAPDERRLRTRRKVLMTLVTGGGAVVAAKTLPSEWTRPIVDRVILPVHAQATGMLTLNAQVQVVNGDTAPADGTDNDGVGIYPAGVNAIDGADDSGMNFLISGTLSPAVAQTVSVAVDVTGGDLDTGATLPLAPVVSDPGGSFAFPTIGTDDIPDNTAETLTITVSTAGAADSVIVINFNGGA